MLHRVFNGESSFSNLFPLVSLLKGLQERKLVNDLIPYEPKQFTPEEKKQLTAKTVTEEALGGPIHTVMDVFFNELMKREIGRLKCLENGCTHFIASDADEYYLENQVNRRHSNRRCYIFP